MFTEPFYNDTSRILDEQLKIHIVDQALDIYGDPDHIAEAIDRRLELANNFTRNQKKGLRNLLYQPTGKQLSEPFRRYARALQDMEELQAARRALAKFHSPASLTPLEAFGLYIIVHKDGRPSIPVQNHTIADAPPFWQHLTSMGSIFKKILPAIGRIEMTITPGSPPFAGTGFLVAPGYVLTNRHVANVFAYERRMLWQFRPGVQVWVDYLEELGSDASAEYDCLGVVAIHPHYDLALLKIAVQSRNGESAPQPVPLAVIEPAPIARHEVYAVGYPFRDGSKNPVETMEKIFSGKYHTKLMCPGQLRGLITDPHDQIEYVTHDCSVLSGQSGSPLASVLNHRVVAIHTSGRPGEYNRAIPLWELLGDPFFTTHGITATN